MSSADSRVYPFLAALFLGSLFSPLVAPQSQNNSLGALPPVYKKWLDEDVRYIISDQERSDFTKLATDQQRDAFVVGFWERRDPSPRLGRNTFKEEHSRRLAYANSNFAARIPGYKTDRGRIYIMYGPPESVQRHAAPERPRDPESLARHL